MKSGRVTTASKIAIAMAIAAFLFSGDRLSLEPARAVLGDPRVLASLLALQGVLLLLGCFRWWVLLRAQKKGMHAFRTLLRVTWIGSFFGCIAPSAVATDIARFAHLRTQQGGTSTRALASIGIDRACGIAGAILATVLLAHSMLPRVFGSTAPLFAAVTALIIIAAAPLVLRRLLDRSAKLRMAWQGASKMKAAIGAAFLASVVAHALKGVALWIIVEATTPVSISAWEMARFAPAGFLVEALPLAPGGFGTAHAAFEYLFSVHGLSGGASAFNVYFLSRTAVSLLGGIPWLLSAAPTQHWSPRRRRGLGATATAL